MLYHNVLYYITIHTINDSNREHMQVLPLLTGWANNHFNNLPFRNSLEIISNDKAYMLFGQTIYVCSVCVFVCLLACMHAYMFVCLLSVCLHAS